MADELRRIETLERLVRHLAEEVAALREEVRGARGADVAPVIVAPPVAPSVAPLPDESPVAAPLSAQPAVDWTGGATPRSTPRPTPRAMPIAPAPTPDFEKLVGRYGTVGLAVLTIVMGVGAFLRWAIDHVEVGPGVRVALGALAAAGTAALGWRLRSRGARQYGNTLIGLALALVHVVAWGAGPYLHVVPDAAALAIAALASVALAAFAWREGEQPLFAAGLGGAFLAPFVTMRSQGRPEPLLLYGGALVLSGTLALRRGEWPVARRILAMGTLLFAGAALASLPDAASWTRRAEAPVFALGAALVAHLAAGERNRRGLAYAHLATALLVLVAYATPAPHPLAALALALDGALIAIAASRGEGESSGGWELRLSSTGADVLDPVTRNPIPWIGAVGFPLAFMGVALFALPDALTPTGSLYAAAFAVMSGAIAAREWNAGASRRGAHVVTAGLATIAATLLALHERTVPLALALAAIGGAFGLVAGRTRTPLALVPSLVGAGVATAVAFAGLEARTPWLYRPFSTPASLAALAATLAWWLVSRETRPLCPTRQAGSDATATATDDATVLGTVALAVAFLWGHEELRHATSPAIATFLLVAYYATTGVAAIGLGRMRGSSAARRVGLALDVLAALKAIVQASAITSIGLRVGSYLLVGAFLLGVAWWYRGSDADEAAAESAGDDAGPAVPASPAAPPPEPASARPVH